jgi:hypothetical protein
MKNDGASFVKDHPVVSHDEWVAARQPFLLREKGFTRLRDELNAPSLEAQWRSRNSRLRIRGCGLKRLMWPLQEVVRSHNEAYAD